ncbi:hypothetical protein MACJ_000027 [Theileria orientalis]|uniref:Uncharacterized protein n=1 Tax=Theileria orientalis TaxID=68886 RepID=A0A976M3F3_THEOR|nr:hypothetical protein MACJ_000027 [Theileria orientalis]
MTIHRNVLKQKHKPFKNSKSNKLKTKPSGLSQKVPINLGRKAKKSQIIAKKKALRIHLLEESPRNVFVISFHSNINPLDFINSLLKFHSPDLVQKSKHSGDGWFVSHPVLLSSSLTHDGIPRRLILHSCPRNLSDILYAASCADILLCLFRGSSPNEPAYDEYGYKILSSLRLQGIPTPVGVNIEAGLTGDRQPSSALVKRYFQSEFGLDKKFTSVFVENDLKSVLSMVACVSIPQLSWRKDKGYMLCSNYTYDHNAREFFVEGYARGMGFSVRHAVHVTSIGDYVLKRIELLPDVCPANSSAFRMGVEKTVDEQNTNDLSQLLAEVECLNEVEVKPEELKDDLAQEVFDKFESKLSIKKIPMGNDMTLDDTDMDREDYYDCEGLSDDTSIASSESDDLDFNENLEEPQSTAKKLEFETRTYEELSFPDEVDTPIDQPAKERFQKYRSLKNIRSCVWDPYESLPLEYFKINEFENFRATMNSSKKQLKANCELVNVSSSYVRLTLMNVSPDDYLKITVSNTSCRPVVVSTILPYERKVSVLNFSVSRTAEGPELLPSKTPLSLFCGFRRFPAIPIYSKSINAEKGKRGLYDRFFKKGDNCIATIYGMSLCPPTPVLAFGEDETVMFGGHVLGSEPCRIIMKRILLTGYPMKVHKRRAIVRYMFFNPSDIKYFKPVQLFTKKGLRGKILQSLGTHGYMKCLFSDFITQDDIVCLPLYKRVYPKWFPFSWTKHL